MGRRFGAGGLIDTPGSVIQVCFAKAFSLADPRLRQGSGHWNADRRIPTILL
jgi:hypothetical protein